MSEPTGAQVPTAHCCQRGANGCSHRPINDQLRSGTGGRGRRRVCDQPSEGLARRLGVPVPLCWHHTLHLADLDRFACYWADRGWSGLSVGDLSCSGSDVDVPAIDRRILPDGYLRLLSDV
jgi:hypothetical protein